MAQEVKDILVVNVWNGILFKKLKNIKKAFEKKYPMFNVVVLNLMEEKSIDIKRIKLD